MNYLRISPMLSPPIPWTAFAEHSHVNVSHSQGKNVSGKSLTGSEPCTGMDVLCKWEPVGTVLQTCSMLIIEEGHSRGNGPVISSMFYSSSGYFPTKKRVLVRKYLPPLKIMNVFCSTTLETGEKKIHKQRYN